MCVLELLDGCSGGSLELNNGVTIVVRLWIDDNLEIQAFAGHDTL